MDAEDREDRARMDRLTALMAENEEWMRHVERQQLQRQQQQAQDQANIEQQRQQRLAGMSSTESERFLTRLGSENSQLMQRIRYVASMPEVGMRQFYELIEGEMGHKESRCIERFFALHDLYLQYRSKQSLAPDHWSGVGPVTYAPAPGGSVVDAAFAKLGA